MRERVRKLIGSGLIAGLLVLLDQLVKAWAVEHLKGNAPIVWIREIFELVYVENRGSAFGMLQGQMWLFYIITPISLILIAFLMWRVPAQKRFLPVNACCVLILAGAVGNFIDRIFRGFVVDLFYFKPIDFPVFNVADCYIVVGIIALMAILIFWGEAVDLIFPDKKKKSEEENSVAEM